MGLRERYGSLSVTPSAPVVFVLDASQSAERHQAEIVTLVQEVLRALPGGAGHTLYFLGNPAPHDPEAISLHATRWCEANRRRVSLITPVFEVLAEREDVRIVVIGSGRIFDLADWEGTSLLERTLLVSLEVSLQEEAVAEEIVRPDAGMLARRLHDPVVKVELQGRGFLPTLWDNSEYRLEVRDGEGSLVGERLENYGVMLHFLAESAVSISAKLTCVSGATNTLAVHPTRASELPEAEVGWLTPEEVQLFQQVLQRESFTCLRCGQTCRWETLRCKGQGGFGHLVYRSLERCRSGLILFRQRNERVSFEAVGCGVVRLTTDTAAIKVGRERPAMYRYHTGRERWEITEDRFLTYHQAGDGVYAVFL